MQVDLDFISSVIPQAQILGNSWLSDADYVIDSRLVQPGEIFVALTGAKFDGHDFLKQALDNGAAGFILNESQRKIIYEKYAKLLESKSILFVPDTRLALIELARAWRKRFDISVVGVTGSVGKTTTKEIIRNILKIAQINALVSSGNQNTMIGASLNILKLRSRHKVAVFEMGISELGNMKQLTELIHPTLAIITQIAHAHMQGLGGLATISKEKREIFSLFGNHDIGIINGDQKELSEISYRHPVVSFGKKRTNQIQARRVVIDKNFIHFTLKIYKNSYPVVLPTCNQTRVMNALAAIAVGYMLEIPDTLLVKAIELPIVVKGRFEILQSPLGAEFINDAYNANPDSVKASIISFDGYKTEKNKIVVLGDMLELGDDVIFWHRQIGRYLSKIHDLYKVVLIGNYVQHMKKSLPYGIKYELFDTVEQAYDCIKGLAHDKNNILLFKASNSMRFSYLFEKIFELESNNDERYTRS
ncbi:UDP-N-acetylmuramoyl-tripeptide--D-alanyl-D-alanine ligase [Candidatus Dependentiae bacterium]|nr:UDP-N-acetylmuramoyl-tripeptide--D-alanyl-D-alanine ligase [Candidatus Dependentiae bacterium]